MGVSWPYTPHAKGEKRSVRRKGNSMMRDWARHLLAGQAAANATSMQTEPATLLVYEKLRRQLSATLGHDGFRALAFRALTLARLEAPGLDAVRVTAEGSLCGLSEGEQPIDLEQADEVGVIFIGHVLTLFQTFLGPATTRRLLQEDLPNLEATAESGTSRQYQGIFEEANNLRSASERLESMADENPAVEDGLTAISENIRNIATLLDVFATVRGASDSLRESIPTDFSTRYLM